MNRGFGFRGPKLAKRVIQKGYRIEERWDPNVEDVANPPFQLPNNLYGENRISSSQALAL